MTPRQGLTGRNVDVRKGNDATSIDRNLGYAMEFDGSAEYLQIALPADLITNGTFETGTNSFWSVGGTVAFNSTEAGKTGNYCMYASSTSAYITKSTLFTIGKKYKIKFRYKSTTTLYLMDAGGGVTIKTFAGTTDWNSISYIYTATTTDMRLQAIGGTFYLDDISIVEDQGFDLNRDQEQILHSKNWNFEGSTTNWTGSGVYSASLSTADKYEGSGSLLISGSVSGSSVSNHVKLTSANLESCVATKKYTLEGFARLDASSLGYGSNLLTGDGTSGWTAGNGTGAVVTGEYVLSSTSTGYIYRTITATNKIFKVIFKVKSATYTGKVRVYHSTSANATNSTENVNSGYQTITLYTRGHTAAGTFYIELLSNHTGDIYFDDIEVYDATPITLTAQLGTKSVTSSALSIVAGTFTKFVLNFEAGASEVNQDLKLWLSGAGSVFVDKLSLTQKYDRVIIKKFKSTSLATSTILIQDGQNYVETRVEGKIRLNIGDGVNTAFENTQVSYSANEWTNICSLVNSTDKMYIIKNGVVPTGVSVTSVGKYIDNVTELAPFRIGANTSAGEKFTGQISHIQIIRFENISQSTFNSAIKGLQYPTGGGAEEVLRLTFSDGTSILNTLKDYSPKNHTVTAVNMDISNRKRVV